MPYTIMPADWIEAGKPTKEEIFQNLVANQISFNTDIEGLKQTSRVDLLDFRVTGEIESYSTSEVNSAMPVCRAPVNCDIVQVLIALLTTSTSGNLEIQLEKSIDNGINWNPLLSTPVTLSGTTVGSISGAVNFTSPATQVINENDLLRISIVGLQVGQGDFHCSIYSELS